MTPPLSICARPALTAKEFLLEPLTPPFVTGEARLVVALLATFEDAMVIGKGGGEEVVIWLEADSDCLYDVEVRLYVVGEICQAFKIIGYAREVND